MKWWQNTYDWELDISRLKKNQSFTAYYIFDLGISLNFGKHKFSHLWNRQNDDVRGIKWDNGWEYFSQNLKIYGI